MEALMAGASRRSLAERLEAWSGVCDAAAAGELADADASAALVSVVFASLREHDDKPSRVALARAVDAALTHSPAFLKAFAARLLKAASDKPQELASARWCGTWISRRRRAPSPRWPRRRATCCAPRRWPSRAPFLRAVTRETQTPSRREAA
jgi:hypothetical protein